MLGYLAVAPDGNTIKGLRFYAHAETPGLGDQMDKEAWRAQWVGKLLYAGSLSRRSASSRAWFRTVPQAQNTMLDGMAGATLTGNGITALLQYWTGPHGFGPYLKNIR